jgi:hypothetical protein
MTDHTHSSEPKRESLNLEGHHPQFSHAGSLDEPSLNQLRDHIKKTMIPLLIKSFQLKLELSQTISLPSRLQPAKQKQSSEEIVHQLQQLDKDLQVLILWCQSCRKQVEKAMILPEEQIKSVVSTSTTSSSHPAVSKSFSEAVSAQANSATSPSILKNSPSEEIQPKRKRWWQKIF